jgi:hypothetical protein
MFILQAIHNGSLWAQIWLAFINYDEAPDKALSALEGDEMSPTLIAILGMDDFLTTLRLAIADSIMVICFKFRMVLFSNSQV